MARVRVPDPHLGQRLFHLWTDESEELAMQRWHSLSPEAQTQWTGLAQWQDLCNLPDLSVLVGEEELAEPLRDLAEQAIRARWPQLDLGLRRVPESEQRYRVYHLEVTGTRCQGPTVVSVRLYILPRDSQVNGELVTLGSSSEGA